VTRDGISLSEYLLPKRVKIDISFPSRIGCVPELEEREAAVYCCYNWNQWVELDYDERVASLAHYRLHLLIEAHINDAQAVEAERKRPK
jgi:hypothetical protein